MSAAAESIAVGRSVRRRVRVLGTVQGVGFRPYVYRLARELELAGYVVNDAHGVLIEVEGAAEAVSEFVSRLAPEAPALARVERVLCHELEPRSERGFAIGSSPAGERPDAPVTPDSATCAACLGELFDPADRRFRYPFINCTECGPRFTIVRGVPYDRPLTTMAAFTMCRECRREYEDPSDRRFHAQPNACPRCGPSLSLLDGRSRAVAGVSADAASVAAHALTAGRIVAVKGIGGYHLACRADLEPAVAQLRRRKHREDKPFALMAPDLETAERLVALDDASRMLLLAPERPIVLAPRRPDAIVAESVAPRMRELGVMLPYSPLHHLLLRDVHCALVMTSGNRSDEPIAYRDEQAIARLRTIADLFLVHDRPIETRTDDSVARVVNCAGRPQPAFVRRSRGYVPAALGLPAECASRPLLACGAQLKNTFCVARGGRAWVSHHIGDLENEETLHSFVAGVEHFERLFAVTPEVIAHDAHPDYLSTAYALARAAAREDPAIELIAVQHHHAHLGAALAEHGRSGPAIGAIFDGAGYGSEGTVWGGELLYGDLRGFRRVGSLGPVRMPGGEQAVRQPWRMACAWLAMAFDQPEPPLPSTLAECVDRERWRQIARLAATGLASPQTTSVGRLFDAVAAICGLRAEIKYEGQAAIELEAACDPSERRAYPVAVESIEDAVRIDPREALRAVSRETRAGEPIGIVAARFHNGLAAAATEACIRAAAAHRTELVVLSGGVFANRRLLEPVSRALTRAGIRVLIPQRLPIGDGGISYGQAAVAAAAIQA
jgi:hydrogenase maturation protein HypF